MKYLIAGVLAFVTSYISRSMAQDIRSIAFMRSQITDWLLIPIMFVNLVPGIKEDCVNPFVHSISEIPLTAKMAEKKRQRHLKQALLQKISDNWPLLPAVHSGTGDEARLLSSSAAPRSFGTTTEMRGTLEEAGHARPESTLLNKY